MGPVAGCRTAGGNVSLGHGRLGVLSLGRPAGGRPTATHHVRAHWGRRDRPGRAIHRHAGAALVVGPRRAEPVRGYPPGVPLAARVRLRAGGCSRGVCGLDDRRPEFSVSVLPVLIRWQSTARRHNTTVEDVTMVVPEAVPSGYVRLSRGYYVGAAAVKQNLVIGSGGIWSDSGRWFCRTCRTAPP